MGKKKILFKSDEPRDLASVAAFLRELADKLEQNEVTFRQGNDEVSIVLPDIVDFEVEVEEKVKKRKTKRSLELEIDWVEGAQSAGPVVLE
ncbi:MAG: amphi-Trp domain-containing protein [Anaerolineae bacterium]|jgi:amphi-Trp domain-containing protein